MTDLADLLSKELARPAAPFVVAFAEALAGEYDDTAAVLFYGSALRTGDRAGILDFYVLTWTPPRRRGGLIGRGPWPDVGYREAADPDGPLRAKVAVMPLAASVANTSSRLARTVFTRRSSGAVV